MKKINAFVKTGSYAWTVAGSKTASGNPIIYSGPQMGFEVPGIVFEGSIRAGELDISGMTLAGIPGILIGRTPHHAWSMQVGHGHTADYYFEKPENVTLHRVETIKVAGADDVQLPVYRTVHGPVISPLPYNPESYTPDPANPIVAWKYSHWGYELKDLHKSLYDCATAASMDEFGAAVDKVGLSHHFCYADKDGNIAYWMSGRDPLRPEGEYRFPQGFIPDAPVQEWDAAVLKPRSTDRNTSQGYYCGWNNKSSAEYNNSANSSSYYLGPFHRAHVVDEYLSANDNLTFEQIRDLALDIAATDSFGSGGNPWAFVSEDFISAVNTDPTESRTAALAILADWDGHFVDGGKENWASGTDRSDGWMLMDAWTREAVRLTFEDELGKETYEKQ
ncbi:penicillin acylase family protein, partial [Desulfobacterales bacterium HSG17]|nr:penicillin acylase family protein [Desulfobacterales bacterium HSG17]